MKPTIRFTTFALVLLAAAGLSLGDARDELIFPHDVHFEEDIDCTDCHDGVETSTSALSSHRPDMDVCAECHDTEDEDLCAQCHTNVDAAEALTPATMSGWNFSHVAHLGADIDCSDCHGDVAVVAPRLPEKALCRSCHETADDFTDCRLCHADDESLTPADHTTGWTNFHGVQARFEQTRCDLCHTRSGCQDCHAGDNVRPRSHDLDFAFGHAIEARGRETDCMTCHQEPEYCSSCHQAERVMPRNHSRADWVRIPDGGRHAEDGLFDLEGCIACHDAGDEAPMCARCHGG